MSTSKSNDKGSKMADKDNKVEDEKKKKKKLRRKRPVTSNDQLNLYKYNLLEDGDAMLRGTTDQNWVGWSDDSRGKQDIANCLTAFAMHKIIPIHHWTYEQIDFILAIGDQLFQDSLKAHPDAPYPKLGFENVLKKVKINDTPVRLKVSKTAIKGVLVPYNLEIALINYFQVEKFGIITSRNEHVAIFYKPRRYFLFNPQGCDVHGHRSITGGAFVMRFNQIRNLVKMYTNYFSKVYAQEEFTITPVAIKGLKRNGTPSIPTLSA